MDKCGIACYEILGAALKGGCIAAPFNTRLAPNELISLINHSQAKALFVGKGYEELAGDISQQLPLVKSTIFLSEEYRQGKNYNQFLTSQSDSELPLQITGDDPVYIVYTGGTTGLPKGALWTQSRAFECTRNLSANLQLGPEDKLVFTMPFFHIGGVGHPFDYLFVGGTVILLSNFNAAQTLEVIQNERATGIMVVPTQLIAMLNQMQKATYDLSSLRRIVYVGSPMPAEILRKGMKSFGPIFVQSYGLTEGGRDLTSLLAHEHTIPGTEGAEILKSAGRPLCEVQLRIIDDNGNDVKDGEIGEIAVNSDHTMVGYWRNPDITDTKIVEGWLHTGDLARFDTNGYIHIVDRKDDMIISGGENIFPREIEEVLYTQPDVSEAVVIGLPDPYWIEKVHALVSLHENSSSSEQDLIEHCKARLAGYKCPKAVSIVPNIPKTAAGKISRRQVKEELLRTQNHLA